jgi:hypothetical protein
MHESLDDGITSRVVTTSGDLFNPKIVVHCRDESTHELGRIIAPELKRDSLDKDKPREKSSGHALLLAIRKKPEAYFSSHKIYRDQDLALGVSVEVDTVLLSWQWELICVRLSELKAEPLQTHPADLTVMTRHDNLFDEIVHHVPVVTLVNARVTLSDPTWRRERCSCLTRRSLCSNETMVLRRL